VLDPEATQRRLATGPHVVGVAADSEPLAILTAGVAELRRKHDLVAPAGDRAADELLVDERTVHVRGVQEAHAELERAVDDRDRLRVVARSVELRHPHAPQPERRYFEPRAAKPACLHQTAPLRA
jgi:hypothetical protein